MFSLIQVGNTILGDQWEQLGGSVSISADGSLVAVGAPFTFNGLSVSSAMLYSYDASISGWKPFAMFVDRFSGDLQVLGDPSAYTLIGSDTLHRIRFYDYPLLTTTPAPVVTTPAPAQLAVATDESPGLSTGAIVGIVIGSVCGAGVLAGGAYYMYSRSMGVYVNGEQVREMLLRNSGPSLFKKINWIKYDHF